RGCPHNGQIDPSWPDEYIERFIRAMIYPPYPTAQFAGNPVVSMEEYRKLRAAYGSTWVRISEADGST
ncbi:MAG: hypothetical protein ABL921_22145, partial [Pirellula sp.]